MSLIGGIASTYDTDTIIILGKGQSADLVPESVFSDSLVIGINDAERIYPTDVTIFHADWVKDALADNQPVSKLYVTSTSFSQTNAAVFRAPHMHLGQENSDLMVQRLLADDIVVEDVLFMTALQVARAVAKARGRRQDVYMVGFDFDASQPSAHALGRAYETDSVDQGRIRIEMQEHFLLNALYMLKESEIAVFHIGERPFSKLTSQAFVSQFSASFESGNKDWNVKVVAELTTNHFGDRDRLARMVKLSKSSGADYVKVQKRNVETFYSPEQLAAPYRSPFGKTFGDYRHQLELDRDDFIFLDALCKKYNIGWFVSVLDAPSYQFIREFEPEMIKLPSTISEHKEYLAMVAKDFDRPIVISTGMTDQKYEKWILDTFSNCPELYLLQCNSAYPTPMSDCEIGVVGHYSRLSAEYSNIIPGYSSHDPHWFASTLAVAAGAKMVEKHVKLGNADWAHFDAVALDLTNEDFNVFVSKIREAEIVMGSSEKNVQPSEHHKYR